MSKRLGCYISEEAKQILESLTKKYKKTQGEVLGDLIKNCEYPINSDSGISLKLFKLSDDEQRLVENALINSNSTLEGVIKDGLLQRSRYLNSVAERQSELDSMSEAELSKATFKGVANYRLDQALNIIMNHNDAQAEKARKVCITKGMVFKLTGSNRQTIYKYFEDNQVKITDHNQKHSLTESDNRKGKGFSFQQLLGVE